MLLFGLPLVLLGLTVALLMARNDAWDLQVDRVLYSVMGTLLLLAWFNALLRWWPIQWLSVGMLSGGGVFILCKLWLLAVRVTDPNLFIQELAETVFWLPTLIIWALLTEANAANRWMLNSVMTGMAVISAYAMLRPTALGLTPDPDMVRILLQVNLACAASLYGAGYFLKRNDELGRLYGERRTLSRLAYTDLLTGLPGRLSLEAELRRLTLPEPRPFALLMVDVDSFKIVNDTLGHAMGDELLRSVATELRRLAGTQARVFRMSGDEFVVLLPGVSGNEAEQLATRLQSEASTRPSLTVGVEATLSIGVSLCPDDATDAGELLRHADSAMYAVKRAGRRHVRRYRPEQDAATERFQVLARDLGHALSRGELGLVFQPVYRLRDLQVLKAEALLRWDHPTLGPVSPAEFIPVAERVGLVKPIGDWVLLEACRAVKQWPGLIISVNVSALQLLWSDFVPSVMDTIRRVGLDVSCLELELTETALLYEDDRAIRALHELRELGVKVSIDDFGSGYSNLARLRSMPLSGVKLDRSIIQELTSERHGEFARALTHAAVGISRNMQVSLTAEGIETPEHLAVVRTLGCDLGQGYGLARPLSAPNLTALLAQSGSPFTDPGFQAAFPELGAAVLTPD